MSEDRRFENNFYLQKKIKQNDYELLRKLVKEKLRRAEESLQEINGLQRQSKNKETRSINERHKTVLLLESRYLRNEIIKFEKDSNSWIEDIVTAKLLGTYVIGNIGKFRENLKDEFFEFQLKTIQPIMKFSNSLNSTLKRDSSKLDELYNSFGAMKDELFKVGKQLYTDAHQLEMELNINGLMDEVDSINELDGMITGIPEEAYELKCPDEELKVTMLQEFLLVDTRYMEEVNKIQVDPSLQEQSENCYNGWSKSCHDIFIQFSEIYSRHKKDTNPKTISTDMILKLLKSFTRQQVLDHEQWWHQVLFDRRKLGKLVKQWKNDRADLFNRTLIGFDEAKKSAANEKEKTENEHKKKEIKEAVYNKICEWREKKAEALEIRMHLYDEMNRKMTAELALEQMNKKEKEEEKKLKIKEYQETKLKEQKEKENRLKELEKYFENQNVYDRQRIIFRKKRLQTKEEEKNEMLTAKEIQQKEKESILEEIRQKVRPKGIERSLLRLWKDTESWKQKHTKLSENLEDDPSSQIFPKIYTFTAEKCTADPRFRLDESLRFAGLEKSEYARRAMIQMKPLQQPRKDTFSTFKLAQE